MVAVLDPGSLSDVGIADELVRRRAEIDRLEAEFAQLAWAGHQRGIGAADGSPSTQAWLRRHTGMRDGEARSAIEAGAVSELLPSVPARLEIGPGLRPRLPIAGTHFLDISPPAIERLNAQGGFAVPGEIG